MVFFSKIGNFGRLGNQLFQIAATIGCAFENGTEAKFSEWVYSDFFRKKIDQELDFSKISKIYYESQFNYKKIEYYPNMDLVGYYQSEKYFSSCKDLIRSYFEFNDEIISDSCKRFYENKCSLHIRRGDYLKLQEHHPVLDIDYYLKGIRILKGYGINEFCVFSDDHEWCEDFFKQEDGFYVIKGNNDITDLAHMSMCNHNIIANSSFSWWGAWLNKNPNKIVISPSNWFGPAKKNIITSDIYCDDWIII